MSCLCYCISERNAYGGMVFAIYYMLLTQFFFLTEKRNQGTMNQYDLNILSLYEIVFGRV